MIVVGFANSDYTAMQCISQSDNGGKTFSSKNWGMNVNESINLMYSKMGTCCPASDPKFFMNTRTESGIYFSSVEGITSNFVSGSHSASARHI